MATGRHEHTGQSKEDSSTEAHAQKPVYSAHDRPEELLATKLFVPASRRAPVARTRLQALLDRDAPLALVSAPAGFGKSTLVASWARNRGGPTSWLTLEPGDDDPRRFYRYLLAAWRKLAPGIGGPLEHALDAAGPFLAATELTSLLNDIGQWGRDRAPRDPAALVLDDYQSIERAEIHAFVESMIGVLPPGVRLVLVTREDPPFALSRLRARDQMVEIRASELRFREDEATAFLEATLGVEVPEDIAAALRTKTEGWGAGLQLAGLSLRGRAVEGNVEASMREFVRDFTGSHRFVLDYLTDEVLSHRSPEDLEFLMQLSVLEEISGPLAEAVTGCNDGASRLVSLEKESLFLIRLDEHREWYRFHHLFAECLRRVAQEHLDEEQRAELERTAFDWLYEHNRPDAALGHALAAGDRERALRMLRSSAETTLHRGDLDTVLRWMKQVPAQWIDDDPLLSVTRALLHFMSLRWQGLPQPEEARDLLAADGDTDPVLDGRRALLRLLGARAQGDNRRVVDAGREALRRLPASEALLRGTAAAILGGALRRGDQREEADAVFRMGSELARTTRNRTALASCIHNRARLLVSLGDPAEALREVREGQSEELRLTGGELPVFGALLLVAEAEVLVEMGDLVPAKEAAEQAIEVGAGLLGVVELGATRALARIARVERRFDDAHRHLNAVADLLRRAPGANWSRLLAYYRARTWSVQARLGDADARQDLERWELEQGALDSDGAWTDHLLPEAPVEGVAALSCRRLLEGGRVAGALERLRELRAFVEDAGWLRSSLALRLLEVRAHDLAGRDCSQALAETLELGARCGFVFVFADERDWLMPLLRTHGAATIDSLEPRFRRPLLAALTASDGEHPATATRVAGQGLLDPLSEREIEVLSSVAGGRTNAQVGVELYISPSTVKTHLESIYSKLAVRSRLEAVTRAQSLGILPPTDPG